MTMPAAVLRFAIGLDGGAVRPGLVPGPRKCSPRAVLLGTPWLSVPLRLVLRCYRHLGVLRCCAWGPRNGHQASSERRGPHRHHAYLRWQSSKRRQHHRLKALLCRRRGGAGGRGRAAKLCCIRDAASQLRPCLHCCI